MATTTYSVHTTRTIVHGPGGQYQVTERTSTAGQNPTSERVELKQASALHAAGGSGSRFSSGWGSTRAGDSKSHGASDMHGKGFEEVKAQCLKEKKLFEDPDFPALDSSIFYSRSPPRPFAWKRPTVSYFVLCFIK